MKSNPSIAGLFALLLAVALCALPAGSGAEQVIRTQVDLVTVPVVVIGEEDQLVTGLKKENFRILEEGQPQEISNFSSEESPLTVVVVVENNGRLGYLLREVAESAAVFVNQAMQGQDYVALVSFDIRSRLEADFTRNRNVLLDKLRQMARGFGSIGESNLFDALRFALRGGVVENVEYKGLAEVEGRTAVLLIATGMDTFSEINYDEAREIVESSGVPVYTLGIGELAYIHYEPYLSGPQRLNFLQAQNTLRTFAESSGGRFYSVRFRGALPDVMGSIAAMLRHQYVLGYVPRNRPAPGEKREIVVQVDSNGDGVFTEDGVEVQHRTSYRVPETARADE